MVDLKLEFGIRRRHRPHQCHHLHRPHDRGGARRQPAHRQRHEVADRPVRRRRASRLAAVRQHRPAGRSARSCGSARRARAPSSGWWACSTSSRIASTGRRCPRRVTTISSARRATLTSTRRPTRRSIRACRTTSASSRCSARRPTASIRSGQLTAGLRYYDFDEDRLLTFAGVFADPAIYTDLPGSTSSDGFSPRVILSFNPSADVQFTAQVSRGFRLGGINDPLNEGLCQPEDLATFSGFPTWDDEEVTQLRARCEDATGRRARHLQRCGVHDQDRGPAGRGRRGLMLIARRPQRRCRIDRRGDGAVRAAE